MTAGTPATRRATLIGLTAVLMFSTLALLAVLSGPVPPFQTVAMAFAVASAIGLGIAWARGKTPVRLLHLPPAAWALGIYGLFGYHFAYFTAVKLAPPVEANLINYLWPLLIVLGSALLPGERLRLNHVAGALLGFAGCAVLILKSGGLRGGGSAWGYAAAVAAALIWSSYSVLCRRSADRIPTEAVTGFCAATAVLAAICHFLLETTVVPDAVGWAGIAGLGLGPVGLAFFTWDFGVKHGDIRLLGTAAYAAPLLSTVWVVLAGLGEFSGAVVLACALIVGGACLAAWNLGGNGGKARGVR